MKMSLVVCHEMGILRGMSMYNFCIIGQLLRTVVVEIGYYLSIDYEAAIPFHHAKHPSTKIITIASLSTVV